MRVMVAFRRMVDTPEGDRLHEPRSKDKTRASHRWMGGFVQHEEQVHKRTLEKNSPAQDGGPKRSEKRGEDIPERGCRIRKVERNSRRQATEWQSVYKELATA